MTEIITLLTDFGSVYPGIMKGVLLATNPEAVIVDISHEVNSIKEGCFILNYTASAYPADTIHVAVVDPGVGTDRKGLIIERANGIFVGPDNGLLSQPDKGIESRVFTIDESGLEDRGFRIGRTFHGRDVFSPVSALLSKGVPVNELGDRTEDFQHIDLFGGTVREAAVCCEVIHIDSFGNVITDLHGDRLREIELGEVFTFMDQELPFLNTYSEADIGNPLVLIGSFDCLELSVNQGKASEMFDLSLGDKIEMRKT